VARAEKARAAATAIARRIRTSDPAATSGITLGEGFPRCAAAAGQHTMLLLARILPGEGGRVDDDAATT
jgi:hypothetical protein